MKKTVLTAATALASFTAVYAQPTLTAATNTPVPLEVFFGHVCDTTTVTQGSSGAAVSWNFSTLTTTGYDTLSFMACSVTPYCDSFPGSNLVSYDGATYGYLTASPTGIVEIGGAQAGPVYAHFTKTPHIIYYPLTYLSTLVDTGVASANAIVSGFSAHIAITIYDSFVCDGYGTLILPTGTFNNTLRIHEITYTKTVITVSGIPFSTTNSRAESYQWCDSNFHTYLLNIGLDTAGGSALHVSSVTYYAHAPALELQNTATASNLEVYPNPANELLNLKFNLADSKNSSVTMTDLLGREVANIGSCKLNDGENNISIPVSGIPAGIYFVRLNNGDASSSQKVVVTR
jgi:hypothetical protein